MADHIESIGNHLYLHKGSEIFAFYPSTGGRWIASRALEVVPPPPEEPTAPPAPTDPPPTSGGAWVHPLPGATLTSGYGYRGGLNDYGSKHVGVDLSTTTAVAGGAVLAPCDLKITVARQAGTGGLWAAGGYVKAHTTSGTPYTLSFFHMTGPLKVSAGQTVKKGTPLGIEGQEGNVSGTHVHIEIWPGHLGTNSVDPVGDGPWFWGDGEPANPESIFKTNGVTL